MTYQFRIKDLLNNAVPPALPSSWLSGAKDAVDFLVRSTQSNEIILYSNVGMTYVNAILARQDRIAPVDCKDLSSASFTTDSHWALEHVMGGGEADRMYLSDPLDHPGHNDLVGGEQLIFRRHFLGVDKGRVRTELSQRMVQALELYYVDEQAAYCRLDDDGDVEPVIKIYDLDRDAKETSATVVTIKSEDLHRYMAVTETALVMRFSFTRFNPKSFDGWSDLDRGEFSHETFFYRSGAGNNASFANGVHVVWPNQTKDMLIDAEHRRFDGTDKEYATFIAHDWKNDVTTDISCSPNALASYFEKSSALPYQTTPAFFKPDVLQKYKSDPEKYTFEDRSIHARAGWFLKTYDINEAGQVHTYLCYLADMPYKEQLYWKSFNEAPKSGISKRAYETDFQGTFSSVPDPLNDIKRDIERLDDTPPAWWKPRGTAADAAHYPVTTSPEEWSNAVLSLDQLVIEGFLQKPLTDLLTGCGRVVDPAWKPIRLLQECLIFAEYDEASAMTIVQPLKELHFLRTKLKGHFSEKEKQTLINKARKEHGTLAAHYKNLAAEVQRSFAVVIDELPAAD